MKQVSEELYNDLKRLGIIEFEGIRSKNIGSSDYSKHIIQPWTIWQEYNLNPWDADIIKRVLRTKDEPGISEKQARIMDYEKIIHICKERIRQVKEEKKIEDKCSESIYFNLDETELNSYLDFIKEHRNKHNGNCYTSITFTTDSGIGVSKKVKCLKCGEEKIITNYNNW